MTIDILCRVVDNYGDIGFVYRLARAFSELPDTPRLRLIVDDLCAFAQLCPKVRTDAALQEVEGMTVVRWTDPGEPVLHLFELERPRLVLECYACGRPDWFEAILFDPLETETRHIVNLEYLTAEPWARDFHRLPSLTRSPLVKKSVFMPGFEPGTGGLLLDSSFRTLLDACAAPESRLSVRQSALSTLRSSASDGLESAFWFLVFSYEHDFTSMVADLAVFSAELTARTAGQAGKLTGSQCKAAPALAVLVAAGRSAVPFLDAWNHAGRPFPVLALPFLEQSLWDRFLVSSDFAVIRGEESFSRAALIGRPFLWQCYPFGGKSDQDGSDDDGADHGGQLPKVHSFLDLVRPGVAPAEFADYERLTLSFNRAGQEVTAAATASEQSSPLEPAPGELLSVLRRVSQPGGALVDGFAVWSRNVRNLGNLASNLLTFLRDLG